MFYIQRLAAGIRLVLDTCNCPEVQNKHYFNFHILTVGLNVFKLWLIFKTRDFCLIELAAVDQRGQRDALGGSLQQVAEAQRL